MSVLTPAAFFSKWQSLFPSDGLRSITGARMREFTEDIKDSFSNVISGSVITTAWKDPVSVATTGNITLSGEQTIDGVLTSGSRVLVRAQTTDTQNGIYVSAAGAWSRATDSDASSELDGAAVGVTQGSSYANTVWLQITDSVNLGVSSIVWQQIGFGVSSQNLSQVLTQGNDGGGIEIENIADPASAQSAATRNYVDNVVSSDAYDTDVKYFDRDDFIEFTTTALSAKWTTANTSFVGIVVNTTENVFGGVQVTTTTSSTGIGFIAKSNGNNSFLLGGGTAFKLRFRATIPVVSDGTDTFKVWFGFNDNPAATGEATDGVLFRYTHSVNSGKWQAVTRVGGVETAQDTGVAPTATVHQVLDIRVNAAGSSVGFYIDGSLTNTITTNIPTGSSNLTNIAAKIEKSAGTTSRTASIDWYDLLATRTTAR